MKDLLVRRVFTVSRVIFGRFSPVSEIYYTTWHFGEGKRGCSSSAGVWEGRENDIYYLNFNARRQELARDHAVSRAVDGCIGGRMVDSREAARLHLIQEAKQLRGAEGNQALTGELDGYAPVLLEPCFGSGKAARGVQEGSEQLFDACICLRERSQVHSHD